MLYAIGDIHGEYRKLDELLASLPLAPQDTLIFIGDYVDRGPDSRVVLDRLIELKAIRPNTVFLRGNHEQMMLDALAFFQPQPGGRELNQDFALMWFYNGADSTLASYPVQAPSWYNRIPPEHWEFIRTTLLEYTTERFHFVHAGLLPSSVKWEDADLDPRLWIREPFIQSKQDFGKVVVFGHTPMRQVLVQPNKIGIDTGAAYAGPLTAIMVDDRVPFSPGDLVVFQAT